MWSWYCLLWSWYCRSGCGRQPAALSLRWLRLCWDNRAPERGSQSRYAARCRGYQRGPIHAGLRRTSLAPIAGAKSAILALQSAIADRPWHVSADLSLPSRKRSSQRTQRWREMDSNHRSPARKSRFLLRKANCGTERGQPKRVVFLCGTDGSDPSPSSGESGEIPWASVW